MFPSTSHRLVMLELKIKTVLLVVNFTRKLVTPQLTF
jgi:hypothetical protein